MSARQFLGVCRRTEATVNDAIASGATLLCGNRREGSLYRPTVLEGTPPAFAPVVMLAPFETLDHAIAMADDSDYSLHAGIFSKNLSDALEAAGRIGAPAA